MADNERDESMGMVLAQRLYLYTLFHVVFGSCPDTYSLARTFGSQTVEAFEFLRGQLERSEFAQVAHHSLSKDGPDAAVCADAALSCAGKLRDAAADSDRVEALAADLSSDYEWLFQIPGERYVHQWESPYVGKESMLFQESTIEVRRYYHEAGFKLQAEKKFPDDHIAAMMDYMAHMAHRAYEAFADGDDATTQQLLETQRGFSERHILTWVDTFTLRVAECDAHGCYAALAGGMAAFCQLDFEMSGVIASKLAEQ